MLGVSSKVPLSDFYHTSSGPWAGHAQVIRSSIAFERTLKAFPGNSRSATSLIFYVIELWSLKYFIRCAIHFMQRTFIASDQPVTDAHEFAHNIYGLC